MNTLRSLGIGILYITIFVTFGITCRNGWAQPLSVDQPPPGTYFSMQLTNLPPTPFDPVPTLDIYADPSAPAGTYFYDDRKVDYSSATFTARRSTAMSADEPPGPGDGSGGSTDYVPAIMPSRPTDGYTPCVTWTNFWLLVSNDSSGVHVTISNTLAGLQYVLLEKQILTDPSWTTIQTLTATGSVTQCSTITPGTNATLFFEAKLTNDLAPLIITPPTNVVVATGASASFRVVAAGSPSVTYQWSFNGANISGATSSVYSIGSAQTTDFGFYTVVVSNAICTATATANLGLSWSKYLTNDISSSPAISPIDGTIFITTLGDELIALDPVQGSPKWSVTVANEGTSHLASSPALSPDGSTVYVGSEDGYLYAFYTNGAARWSNNMNSPVYSSPAVSPTDGTVYVCTLNGSLGLVAVNPLTGVTNWAFQGSDMFGAASDSSPAVGKDGTIYFVSAVNGRLYAIYPDGGLKWFFPLAAAVPNSSPAIDADGNILVGSNDGYVYCVGSNGGLRWLYNTGTEIVSSIAVGNDSTVYAASTGGNLYAITNGVLKWQYSGTSFVSSPAVTSSNVVFIGNNDSSGGVYGINNGTAQVTRSTAGTVWSSPAIDPFDGGIIIADMAGYIYKFPGIGNLPTDAPWPMFHQNPAHSGTVPIATTVSGGTVVFPNNPSLDLSSSNFQFKLDGTPGSIWEIVSSTNMVDWSTVETVTLDSTFGHQNVSYITAPLTSPNQFFQARSGNSCSPIIGFNIQTFGPGTTNLVSNPFFQVNDGDYPANSALGLTTLIQNNSSFDALPNNLQIWKWNGVTFESCTWLLAGQQWSPNGDMILRPGRSLFIVNTSTDPATIPFMGVVPPGNSTNPISGGVNFIGSLAPKSGRIQTDLGLNPNNGDQLLVWNTNHYTTNTYSSSAWSPSEPTLGIGQGVVFIAAQANDWVTLPPPCPNLLTVTAYPLWTDSGIIVTNGDTIHFPAEGTWSGGAGPYGPDGIGSPSFDNFVANYPQFGLIAFVGPDPLFDSNGTNRWRDGTGYFPQVAKQNGGTNGYWWVGTTGVFTTDRTGKLWFGFNDDALVGPTDDNSGAVFGEVTISH